MPDPLVSIVGVSAIANVIRQINQEFSLFAVAAHELERLRDRFHSIQAVPHDAESRQVYENSERLWLSRLRDVSYDMEDVLDDGKVSGDLVGGEGDDDEGDGRNKACACLFALNNSCDRAVSRYYAARRIKVIRERLEQIDDEKNKYSIGSSSQGDDHIMLARSQRVSGLFMEESEMMIIGRGNDKEIMISRLVSESSSREGVGGQVHVVAVVGIEGLGKTTLVRQIYHDRRVRDHFNMFLWVCASEVFDVIRLTKAILNQVKGRSSSLSELDSLQNELLQELRGKRFLLVLDDVWNDEEDKCKMLQLPLNSGAQGSRILVTTRFDKVANTMNAAYIHELECLSDDDSWALFSSRAFAGRKAEEHSVLEGVRKEIVNSCKGVPLVIKVIGSLMHSKRTVEDWKSILDSIICSSTPFRALFLTYLNFPAHLKRCFEYYSMFPNGWEFKKDSLVRLWVAQGFIWLQENREIEDLGAEHFDELVSLSMFQQVQEDGETRYKMHGFHYDLAKFILKDEIYTSVSEGQWLSSNFRDAFLSFADNDDKPNNIPIAAGRAKMLRTLWIHGMHRSDRVIVDILRQAKSLRALSFTGSKSCEKIVKSPAIWKMRHLRYLDFSGSDIVALPNVIGKMKYLKYLNLSCLNIVELPESVSHLRNLHTLNLTGCVKLKRLPRALGKMVSLRYLEIDRTDSLECLPKGLGRINGLQSICKFIVGEGEEGGCQIDELQRLKSLQGILRIQCLERVSSRGEAEKAELWNKPHLRGLVLSMFGRDDADIERSDGVLEGLRPHKNLEELKLFWYTGSNLPRWLELMPRLHKLELCGCPNLEWSLHRLDSASLRELMIRSCQRIEGISGSSSVFLEKISVIDSCEFFSNGLPHLPKLKTFEIRSSRNKKLPDGGWEQLVALQTLEIWNCDELKTLPDGLMHLQSLENLIIYGCDKLERLPEGLGQLKKLKSLTIGVLKVLTCLPDSLVQLESLEHLEVSSCKKFESLPHGLQHLYLLRRLSICGCPLLSERCKREGGVDWPKISHIPDIEIDKQRIQ